MLQGWVVVAVALGYIGLLFVVASYGDRMRVAGRARLLIYPLSLAIYCTSWTFFGSVGLASRTGYDFLTIYVGPMLMIGLGLPLILRIVRLAKAQNITSIADFIAARYGKGQAVAATVALIAILGTIPYIALQLKAVSSSLSTILAHTATDMSMSQPVLGDIALFVALSMAAFAVLFGTRHIDATEHQDGLMLAIAAESIVKLIAFVAVGVFVTFWMFDGPTALFSQAMERPATAAVLTREPAIATLSAMTLLSFVAIVLLPRQFHVTVVENNSEAEIRRASWLFPLYLVLINLFVLPIAMAGLLTFPAGGVDSDMFVLALPLVAKSDTFTLIAFIGGLSAATAMVIVETVALAIMVSNDIVMPWVLQRRETLLTSRADVGGLLLKVRRTAIVVILLLAYVYYRSAGEAQLAAIGLLAFAAVAQLAPAFFGGMFWRRATARGAIAGMTLGILTWGYTLLLPSIADIGIIGRQILTDGPWGFVMLRPQGLFGLELHPLVHGVIWSLTLNVLAYIGFSLRWQPTSIERMQADVFVPSHLAPTPSFRLWRSSITVEELTTTVARYLGQERTRSSFESFAAARRISLDPQHEADFQLLRYAEHLLASAIGAASSRLVLSLLLRKRTVSTKAALKLLDDASAAIHYNREILQTALDHVRQGIAVFDKDLRLVCWNRQFGDILDLPTDLTRVGIGLDEIVRCNARQGALGPGPVEALVIDRITRYTECNEPVLERFALSANGQVFLLNPNGILFGNGAQVNVGGLVASTRNITDGDFMAGRYKFSGTGDGAVVNQGSINANGGYVALLGATVSNEGVISARLGTVALAAGNAVTLDVAGDGLLNVVVNRGAVNALVQNGGLIRANGGQVLLTAQSAGNLLQSAVNNTGVIRAQTIENRNGTIRLMGDMQTGTVNVGGTLDASGGATGETGGRVIVTGHHVGLFDGHINASGDAGGGTVLVGGGFQGNDPAVRNASATYMSADSTINVDAITHGNGGTAVVWSNDSTRAYGSITARGGAQGGNGGLIETSGHWLDVWGVKIDAGAPNGKGGLWLLDPADVTISAAADSNGSIIAGVFEPTSGVATANVDAGALQGLLNAGTSVMITTTNAGVSGGGNGDITVNAALTWVPAATSTLTLNAVRDVNVNSAIDITNGNLVVCCGRDINVNAPIRTQGAGGSILLAAGNNINMNAAVSLTLGNFTMCAGNNVNVNAAITLVGIAPNPALSLGLADGLVLSAGNNGTGPGVVGGTVIFGALTPPAAITNAPVNIFYNPVSYTVPTDYSTGAFFTLVGGLSTVTQFMLVFPEVVNQAQGASTAATFTGLLKADSSGAAPVGVTLAGAGTGNFGSTAALGTQTVTFNGFSLGGPNAADFALPATAVCCLPAVQRTTGIITAAAPPGVPPGVPPLVVLPPVVVPPLVPPLVPPDVGPPLVVALPEVQPPVVVAAPFVPPVVVAPPEEVPPVAVVPPAPPLPRPPRADRN